MPGCVRSWRDIQGQMRVTRLGVTNMGHSRKRVGETGAARYTAYWDDARGKRHSAGTFASKKAADNA